MKSAPYSVIFIAFLLYLPHGVESETLTLPVTEDTWIHGLNDTNVFGSGDTVSICPSAFYWIYLKFNLSGLTDPVANAELRMVYDGFGESRPDEIAVYLITDDGWSEGTLNGPDRPPPTNPADNSALVLRGLGQSLPSHDQWTSEDFVQAIEQQRTGDGILSLMVREDPGNPVDVRRYASRENSSADGPELVLTTATETVNEDWQVADVGIGTKPAFDYGPDDSIRVMGMTEAIPGEVWYASAPSVAGPWSPRSVTEGYYYGPGDLIVDSAGAAHLAWHNHDSQNPNHVIIEPNGNETLYNIHTIPPFHDGWDNALAFDSTGRLHQSSINPSAFGSPNGLQYGVFDGGIWTYFSGLEGSGSVMYGLATSIGVDRQDNPHIAYCQATGFTAPGDLIYATSNAGVWSFAPVTNGGISGRFPSLALDHWDRPHIAWLNIVEPGHTSATVHYGVLNAGIWTIEQIDTLDNVRLEMGPNGARKSVSLVLDEEFRPHVAYADQRVIKYVCKPFTEWEITTVLQHDVDTYKGLVELQLDSRETPGIVFWEDLAGEPGLVRLVELIAPPPPNSLLRMR